MDFQRSSSLYLDTVEPTIDPAITHRQVGRAITRIETIFEAILDSMARAQELSIRFRSRRRIAHNDEAGDPLLRFPGRSPLEARKFARVLLVLQLAHQALTSGIIFTKRHIYYQHQDLFETQRNVDEIVDDVAFTLGIGRDDLNITASPKGLYTGCIEIRFQDASTVNASTSNTGLTIPIVRSITGVDILSARWLLVVEKDAVFQSLASAKFCERAVAGPGILVTAKGYPDLMTRSFLSLIQMYKPELPMLALTDFDPDGISIFSCYRYGTQAFSHESMDGDMKISWLGIKSGHLHELEVDLPEDSANTQANIAGSSSVSQRQKTTSGLTKRDRKYAVGMLKKLDARGPRDGQIEDMVREIQLQLMLGVTIEIQAMVDHGDLISWLDERLQNIFFA